jgi:hypothetical protein
MAAKGDPWDIPEWHFIRQEAMLVRHLIGAGATAIGQANYANKKGEYYRAFFELSVGMERLAKLILVVDYALAHRGKLPDEKHVKQFGHDLQSLFSAVDQVSTARTLNLRYPRPTDAVATAIIANLDAFADAKRGRYANFGALANPQTAQHEPIAKWWTEVAEAILKDRYYGKPVQEKVEGNARAVGLLLSGIAVVRHTTETRDHLSDIEIASRRTGQTELVQKWARYHSLTIVRWLSDVYRELAEHAVYKQNYDAFFGSWEFFDTYRVDQEFLKSRKIWPLD